MSENDLRSKRRPMCVHCKERQAAPGCAEQACRRCLNAMLYGKTGPAWAWGPTPLPPPRKSIEEDGDSGSVHNAIRALEDAGDER